MNRKLIRPNLSDVKGKDRDVQQYQQSSREHQSSSIHRSGDGRSTGINGSTQPVRRPPQAVNAQSTQSATNDSGDSLSSNKNRRAPSAETNAEIYYYKKQIDSHTPMIILLTDGEEIEGTIEWYDVHALKVNRKNAPNIMLLKHNIKYMYKAEDRVSPANNMES